MKILKLIWLQKIDLFFFVLSLGGFIWHEVKGTDLTGFLWIFTGYVAGVITNKVRYLLSLEKKIFILPISEKQKELRKKIFEKHYQKYLQSLGSLEQTIYAMMEEYNATINSNK
jgi:hypothetical protein